MDTIVTPVTVITLDSTRIVHSIKADLVARYFPPVVRLVQYDQSLPVIAVSLMQNGQTYTLPSGAAANIRVHKPDATYVYNPALGCDSTRNIVYFEVTQAMAAANGDGLAIVEIVVDGDIAGTSLITLHFEENPVPEDAIESSDEWETIYELGERIIASTVTPVSTAAGMTDHNVVYLYTGTESGWNQGHMYYYNGTTWVDAGIAVTDTTLSVAGLAADAKKTGDEIADLKDGLTAVESDVTDLKEETSDINNVLVRPSKVEMEWTQGNINASTGANAGSARYIRTNNYLDVSTAKRLSVIFANGNYNSLLLNVFKYGDSYIGKETLTSGTHMIDISEVSSLRFSIEPISSDTSTVINPNDGNNLLDVEVGKYFEIAPNEFNERVPLAWERGKISDTGNDSSSSSTTFMRSKYRYEIPTNKFKLEMPNGITCVVFAYSTVGGLSFLNKVGTYKQDAEIPIASGTYIRIMANYADGSDIPLSVGDSIVISYQSTVGDFICDEESTGIDRYCSLSMFQSIGVIGDSYASGSIHKLNGSYTSNYDLSWGQILARKIGATVTNFSEGGLSTKTWLSDNDHGLSTLLADSAKQLYILNLGINDNTQINAGTLSLGSVDDILSDYTQNPDTFYGDYGRIIGNILDHAPNALILLLSVARPNERNMDVHIKAIAEKCGVPFISLIDDAYFTSGYFYGSINEGHPLAYGYSGMANAIERLINRYIVENPLYFGNYDGITS